VPSDHPDRRPVLVIEHQATCPPGWLGEWLTDEGLTLDIRRPYAAAPQSDSPHYLPSGLAAYCALVVLGGSMGANDDATVGWLGPVKKLIREAAERELPTLGVCLGHQLAAVALGGRVEPNPRGQTMGLQHVPWTTAAHTDPVLGPVAGRDGPNTVAVQWNNDIVVAEPAGSTALARAGTGELLAARFAPTVWGVQWHPEAGADLIGPWADKDRAAARDRGVDVDAVVGAVRAAEPALRHTWSRLARGFAAAVSTTR